MSVSTSDQNSEISFRDLNLSPPLLEALERGLLDGHPDSGPGDPAVA